MKMRQDELKEILAQAGPKGKELAHALSKRGRTVEVHFHISGPVFIGSDIARTIAPILFRPDSPVAANSPQPMSATNTAGR